MDAENSQQTHRQHEPQPASQRQEQLDCVILGAGPAGLTALEYLARFHRRVVALGASGRKPRLLFIDRTYNLPGYPEGIPGPVLLHRLREQAESMGGAVCNQIAERIEGENGNFEYSERRLDAARAQDYSCDGRARSLPRYSQRTAHEGKFPALLPGLRRLRTHGQASGILGSGGSVARHALFPANLQQPHQHLFAR
jgi:thioredoxin reductase (NADPH)